ncbi:NADP-dependent oxidoreductase [Salinigranum halophilum]|uniref:NADP-dependent oxidoreductase n=1 Tax=Salinigranum halophilum TaxID=2565931 RepID=UPI0010A9301E|nr:NADP-dependent oxidoreductase [Salinigranum halophilum]
MKRVEVSEFGGPDSLTVTTDSVREPMPHEALVRIHAAGVNPYDWMTRKGNGADVDLPWTPRWDFSGVIAAVGSSITEFFVGDEVFGMLSDERGAYTEYATIPATNIIRKPRRVSHVVAAGVPMVALTAWQSLFETGRLHPTQRVLVHAAAGGVGHMAVQLANWIGAYTIGTASASNRAYLEEIELDEFVNYRQERIEAVVNPVDLVVDTVGGDTFKQSIDVLIDGGRIVKLPGPLTEYESDLLNQHDVNGTYPVVQWRPEHLCSVARLLKQGRLDLRVDSVFPLERVAEAHQLSESGHARGKVVLQMPSG